MIHRNEFAARKLVSDAVAIGKKYSGTSYPNPSRTGCPDAETLKAMARRDDRISLQEMPVSHIVTCSPCFNQYARYRRSAITFRGLQWAAAILLITATIWAGTRFLHLGTSRQNPALTAGRSHSAPAAAPPPASGTPEQPSQVEVNLALYSTRRGNDFQKPKKAVHLPAKAIHVLFFLPTGMEPGEYIVRLQDAAGATKIQRQVEVELKGGVAEFTLDLQFKPSDVGRGWTLMIRQRGLSWRSYPLVIG